MKEVKCPYCCKCFPPTRMVFRLRKSLREQYVSDVFAENNHISQIVDEEYKKYLMDIEGEDERTAETHAGFDAEAIEINFSDMIQDIEDYDEDMYNQHKFVQELTYKGQRLSHRLCPFCHNELVPQAGLYDMNIIAMYGDTGVGKTVYLNVLRAVLETNSSLRGRIGDAFGASVYLVGDDDEVTQHNADYNVLMEKKMLPKATEKGKVVRPKILCYRYVTADKSNKEKGNLLVFRDIPGEDIRQTKSLEKYKFYLKNADALIILLDATKLRQVQPHLAPQGDNEYNSLTIGQALGNLSNMVAAIRGDGKIEIPTAVVLAKADVLNEPKLLDDETKKLFDKINTENANNLHKGYVDRGEIIKVDRNVQKMLKNMSEDTTIINPVSRHFLDSSFFAVSALGEKPKKNENEEQYVEYITPMRVAEPLYWILSKLNHIPYFHHEVWRSNKEETDLKNVDLFYYDREIKGSFLQRLAEARPKSGKFPWSTKWTLSRE